MHTARISDTPMNSYQEGQRFLMGKAFFYAFIKDKTVLHSDLETDIAIALVSHPIPFLSNQPVGELSSSNQLLKYANCEFSTLV